MYAPNHSVYNNIMAIIRNDVGGISNIKEIRIDPIGNTIYLFFLLKNNKRGYEIEALIDWMNEWINDILINEKITKSIDVEITSAILGYNILKKYNKLKYFINNDKKINVIKKYFKHDHFFDSFALTCLLAKGITEIKDKFDDYSKMIGWIKNNIEKQSIFNDGKNILFSYMLFKELNDKETIKKIYDYCYTTYKKEEILFVDELFYSYVLWNNKDISENRQILKEIRRFTEESITNADEYLKSDVNLEISKIYKGILLDLSYQYQNMTIIVTKEEISLDDIDRIIFIYPTLSIFFIGMGIYLINLKWIGLINILIEKYIYQEYGFLITLINICINIIIMSIFSISTSILWDTVYKKIARPEIILYNIKERMKNYVINIIIPALFEIIINKK